MQGGRGLAGVFEGLILVEQQVEIDSKGSEDDLVQGEVVVFHVGLP